MSAEQVCLKWNNFPSNITRNIDELWKDESLVDVSICSEGQCIQAHKVILSASSPLFKSIFAVNPCQHPVIILQDVRFREIVSIISFIYKGEVNIDEQNLPAVLKAAKTLQIRGLSDSVDPSSNIKCSRDSNECPVKKRRIYTDSLSDSVDDDCKVNTDKEVIPKKEPTHEEFIPEFISQLSDEEDFVKNENITESENLQDSLQVDSGGTVGTELMGNMMYLQMPFANLLPPPEVLLRWSQTRSLDQLAIDLMKKLFTTEERLVCNVNGKMGKPRFHTGKISLLREVVYYYSGLPPPVFESHWKNCVTKIDTSNRGLKRNRKLRTQMIIMDSYLSKNYT